MRARLLVIVAATATCACGARVPDDFGPQPMRLPSASLAIEDHRAADEVTILLFGDSGRGNDDQMEVGRRMASTTRPTWPSI